MTAKTHQLFHHAAIKSLLFLSAIVELMVVPIQALPVLRVLFVAVSLHFEQP